ncbi:hypothetical protein F8388_025175 [Cannabis sativa]|uniref:Myb-like domain-containing protein n=1 Tax=Cannabis sativa TaxID=3483 RepID=A0A7J6FRX3_CANSA|nr:hypothetical protein F8388_025175 [Cannabis sativa]
MAEKEGDLNMDINVSSNNKVADLVWIWIIEALASFKEVNFSLLNDLVKAAPEIPDDDLGKNAKEMVAFRSLETLFERVMTPSHDQSQHSKLKSLQLSKWDIQPFLNHKRASMEKCTLVQFKEAIFNDSTTTTTTTHPYAEILKEKGVLDSIYNDVEYANLNKKSKLYDDDDDDDEVMKIEKKKTMLDEISIPCNVVTIGRKENDALIHMSLENTKELIIEREDNEKEHHQVESNNEANDVDDHSPIKSVIHYHCSNMTSSSTPHQHRRKRLHWTNEELHKLKEGVKIYSGKRKIPWRKILESNNVFKKVRTAVDLKDKWKNICKATTESNK